LLRRYNRCSYRPSRKLRRRIMPAISHASAHGRNFCVDRYFKLKPAPDWKTDTGQVLAGALADHSLYA